MEEFSYVSFKKSPDTDNGDWEIDYEATYRRYKDLYRATYRRYSYWYKAFCISLFFHGLITLPFIVALIIAIVGGGS